MSILRPLYDRVIRYAESPNVAWLLFLSAFIEPWLLPIPPDVLLIPSALARRDKAFKLAAVCTIGSVLGGMIGYAIGDLAMATFGKWIVTTYHLQAGFDRFQAGFQKYGMWIILAKGLTPIPFILVCIASGVAKLNFGIFVVSATITRGMRFFFEAALIYKFGDPIRHFLEKHLTWLALAVLAAILLGFWVVLR